MELRHVPTLRDREQVSLINTRIHLAYLSSNSFYVGPGTCPPRRPWCSRVLQQHVTPTQAAFSIAVAYMLKKSTSSCLNRNDIVVYRILCYPRCAGTEAAVEAVRPVAGAALSKSSHGREVALVVSETSWPGQAILGSFGAASGANLYLNAKTRSNLLFLAIS
jgi:hypothetical protein